MSFKDRFASTDITPRGPGERNCISIGIDEDRSDNIVPTILYIPEFDKQDHDHIQLSKEQAIELYNWLHEYAHMEQKELIEKYKKDCTRGKFNE